MLRYDFLFLETQSKIEHTHIVIPHPMFSFISFLLIFFGCSREILQLAPIMIYDVMVMPPPSSGHLEKCGRKDKNTKHCNSL